MAGNFGRAAWRGDVEERERERLEQLARAEAAAKFRARIPDLGLRVTVDSRKDGEFVVGIFTRNGGLPIRIERGTPVEKPSEFAVYVSWPSSGLQTVEEFQQFALGIALAGKVAQMLGEMK